MIMKMQDVEVLHNLVGAHRTLVTFLSLMKKRESIVKAKLLKECEESEKEGPKIGHICVRMK